MHYNDDLENFYRHSIKTGIFTLAGYSGTLSMLKGLTESTESDELEDAQKDAAAIHTANKGVSVCILKGKVCTCNSQL
jgi:hypothetical protein